MKLNHSRFPSPQYCRICQLPFSTNCLLGFCLCFRINMLLLHVSILAIVALRLISISRYIWCRKLLGIEIYQLGYILFDTFWFQLQFGALFMFGPLMRMETARFFKLNGEDSFWQSSGKCPSKRKEW